MKRLIITMAVFMFLMACVIADMALRIQTLNHRGVEIQRDTIVRIDTVRITEVVEKWRRTVDYMEVPVTDTVIVNDTVFISLPREQKMYEDTSFRAYVSGYRPALDSILIFAPQKEITVTKEVVRKKDAKLGVGLQGGYGVSKGGLTPYIGIGLSYNLLTF